MRGTKAKALRKGCADRKEYRLAKRFYGTTAEAAFNPYVSEKDKRKRRKPMPVAPRAGAKPMHLVRKLVELRSEMGHSTPKRFLKVWGATPKPLLGYMLRDAKEIGDLRPYVTQKD